MRERARCSHTVILQSILSYAASSTKNRTCPIHTVALRCQVKQLMMKMKGDNLDVNRSSMLMFHLGVALGGQKSFYWSHSGKYFGLS